MPTYEFRCPQGHEFEKLYRTISGAEAQSACPVCGQVAERIMSPAGFAFKGSGFYLTDYGKNAHRDKGSAP
jgi:putative FmdB family regulatory protein